MGWGWLKLIVCFQLGGAQGPGLPGRLKMGLELELQMGKKQLQNGSTFLKRGLVVSKGRGEGRGGGVGGGIQAACTSML